MISGTKLRVLTASVLMPLVVAAIWWGPNWLLAVLAGAIAVLTLLEFFRVGAQIGMKGYRLWTCLAAAVIFVWQWYAARAASNLRLGDLLYEVRTPRISLDIVLFFFLIGLAVIALASRRPVSEVFSSVSISAAGLIVIVLPFSAVVRLQGVDTFGPLLLLFTVVLVWVGDSSAYFAGRTFGRWKMSPEISPGKTWEGAFANLLGALLVGAIFGYWTKIPPIHMLAMAGFASIAGQVGDLFESAFKRSAGVKDSGTILPGHGGMWDRIDALILAAPAVWYYFEWVVLRRK